MLDFPGWTERLKDVNFQTVLGWEGKARLSKNLWLVGHNGSWESDSWWLCRWSWVVSLLPFKNYSLWHASIYKWYLKNVELVVFSSQIFAQYLLSVYFFLHLRALRSFNTVVSKLILVMWLIWIDFYKSYWFGISSGGNWKSTLKNKISC